MSLIVPSNAEKLLLEYTLGVNAPANQKLKLFVNDYTPVDGSLVGNFTEMSTLSYVEKTLTKTSWVVTQGADGDVASAAYAAQTWTFSAGTAVDVFGYYIIDTTSGLLLWAERFPAKKTVGNTNDQIIITPKITGSRA